jgi:Peptidase family M28
VLNGRIYRAAFVPLLFALVIAGFSLTERAAPLGSTLTPEAFEGARAFAELQSLAGRFPERRPGSLGDQELAHEVARTLRGLGGSAKGGFAVSAHSFRARTIDGERTLTTVIAQRPGTTGAAPIVILAHRDAAGRGAEAELSGTAVLLELARVLAAGATQRTIVLVSTSGGSGGNAGAEEFAAHAGAELGGGMGGAGAGAEGSAGSPGAGGPIDAALVLGDLAGTHLRAPLVASYSDGPSSAPGLLRSTLAAALAQQAGVPGEDSSPPGTWAQLAHLAFPLTAGEQGPLDARGLPAALLSTSGERPPPANEPVSAARLEGFGRAVLSTVYALDASPAQGASSGSPPAQGAASGLSGSPSPAAESQAAGFQTGLPIQHKAIPGWALRLLVAALLAPALLALGDGLARLRRRGRPARPSHSRDGWAATRPSGPSPHDQQVGRWVLWTLACALPFLAGGLFAIVVGRLGAIPAPRPPVAAAALPFDGPALEAALATALVWVLTWLGWPAVVRRLGLPRRPSTDAAALAPLLVAGVLAVVVWVRDPLTALLLVPALHVWLVFASPLRPPPRRVPLAALAVVALGVVPFALLVAFYAAQLDLGPGGVAHTALLLLASGRVGVAGAVLWSVAFGCLAAVLLVALAPPPADDLGPLGPEDGIGDRAAITIRGPLSYAGPGSLGGTESAPRR